MNTRTMHTGENPIATYLDDLTKASARVTGAEIKLRMAIGNLFTHLVISDSRFRQMLKDKNSWTPTTTVIPCEGSRTVGEVRELANRAFDRTENRSVIVPVLIDNRDETLSLVIGAISRDASGNDLSEEIANVDPRVTMQDLREMVASAKNWGIREVTVADRESFLN